LENHVIYSDESGYNGKCRYGSIAVISGKKTDTASLSDELQSLLDKYSKTELKFEKVRGHHATTKVAKEFISLGLKYCGSSKIKLHVIIWDTKDKRHDVKGRDDIENMKRMYYHILKRAKADWVNIENWEFYPDEFSAINWTDDVIPYIESTNLVPDRKRIEKTLFGVMHNVRFPYIHKHEEKTSITNPIIQLCDLFAGLIRLSYENGEKYSLWLEEETGNNSLFPVLIKCDASKSEKAKFEVMKYFKDVSSKYGLGVNFSLNKYFTTFSKKYGLVIWFYKPQGDYDKAPVRKH
jgi:hypothetical protein